MSFDLQGKAGESRWSNHAWSELLGLAEAYGWERGGTGPPKGVKSPDWDGGYATNDGQLVSAADARRLADALEAGLAEGFARVLAERAKASPQQFTAQDRNDALERLAAVASSMSFEIVESPPRAKDPKVRGKAKRKEEPKSGKPRPRKTPQGDPLSALLGQHGIRPEELPALLGAIYSNPSAPPDQEEPGTWFTEDEGKSRLAEFIAFCREGSFRIF